MMSDIDSRLATCFAAIFPDLSSQSLATLSAADTADWDSLATVNLVGVIEEEFDVDIRPEDAKRFDSFPEIAKWLAEQAR